MQREEWDVPLRVLSIVVVKKLCDWMMVLSNLVLTEKRWSSSTDPVVLQWRVWAFPDDLLGHIIQVRYKPGKGGCTLFGEKLEYVLVWVSNEVSNREGEAIMWWRMSGVLENEFFKSGSWSPYAVSVNGGEVIGDREGMRRWQKLHIDCVF